jgi:hypothetical protein
VSSTPAIHSITARIGSISSRFEPRQPEGRLIVEGDEFDPFGDAYQQAVAAAASRPATATQITATPTAFATRLTESVGPIRGGWYPGGPQAGTPLTPSLVDAAIIGRAGAPGARPIGGYGPMPVPVALASHGNGRVPVEQLSPIAQQGHRLFAPAAASWDSLVRTAAADGFDLRITDSYRSFDEQVDLAERKGLYANGGLAARPGTSNHGWGLAVDADVTDPALLDWLRVNGPRFGWVESVPREPWHWEFRPSQV